MSTDKTSTDGGGEGEQEAHQSKEKERERSTIQFPYHDLSQAVNITNAVHAIGGSSCQWEQLAAKLNQAATGGGFRQRVLTAKTFGLIRYSKGTVTLTPLGNKICDPQQEKKAKVDAFLTVPLYKLVYEKFKSGVLPPKEGLDNEMVAMGVATKQKDKARQAFHRSAQQAGFFWSGQDRLVLPVTNSTTSSAPDKDHESGVQDETPPSGGSDGGSGGEDQHHPFIQGLIKTLPKTETEWPITKRAQWLQTAASVFNLIYKDDESTGTINVQVQGLDT